MSTLRVQVKLIRGRCTALLFYAAFFLATGTVPGYAHVEFISSTGAEFVEEDGTLDCSNTFDAYSITAPNGAVTGNPSLNGLPSAGVPVTTVYPAPVAPAMVGPGCESFDNFSQCPTLCSASCTLQNGWINETGDDKDWTTDFGVTSTNNTGPSDDVTGGGAYLYLEASNCDLQTAILTSPTFDISGLANPELSFHYHMFGAVIGTLSVQVESPEGSGTYVEVWSLSGQQQTSSSAPWEKVNIALSGSTAKIRFVGTTAIGFTGDLAIDEICVGEEQGTCDLAINTVDKTDETCPGEEDGTITINANCTTCTGILYSIDGGTNTQASPTFTGLAPGTYQPYVEDSGDDTCNDAAADETVADGVDSEAPSISCPGTVTTAGLLSNCQKTLSDYTPFVNISDNCDTELTLSQSPVAGTIITGEQDLVVTVTATDDASLMNSCTYTVPFRDVTAPDINCPENVIVQATAATCTPIVTDIAATASDNCTASPAISYSTTGATATSGNGDLSGSAFAVGVTTVTYTATDGAMQTNEADCSFTITVQDNTDCGCSNPQPGDSCDDGDPQTDNDVVQADCSCVGVSCDIAITSVTETDETCPGEEDGTITINASCTSCDGILYSIDGGATTQASPTFTGLATGSYQPYVEDSGDDTCNDVDTDVVISTEADTEAPDMVCRKATIEIEIGQILTAAQVDSNSTDNCAITQLSVAPNVFGCGNVGSNTVTLTAADAAGNLNTCTATVNVVDNVDPEALCQNTTVQLDANGQGSITAGDIDNGSNDACGIASLSLDNSDFTCSDLGNGNTVTLTVTDNNGNPSTCTATVTVEDNEAPTAICLSTTVLIQPDGTYTLQEADVFDAANSFDNCAITQVNFPAATYTCDDVFQTFPVNVTISDAAGNSDNCTASVYVEIGTALPAGWSASDIGQVTVGNEYTYDPCAGPTGEFTVTGSGNNGISTTTDNVAFAGQTLCGDGMITAKIESITPNGYGGLMIRETTAAGSKQVSIFSNLTNVLRHEVRAMTNGPKQIQSFYKPFPFWLRLQRQGNWILTYYSTTGGNFQYIHAEFMPMQGCVEIGLASFTYLPNAQTDAVFSNVSISGSAALIDAGGLPTAELGDSQQMEPELFPNPTNSQFTLRFPQALQGEATASLRNQVGQVLQQRQLQPGDMTTEWNVSQLPAGLYFMEVRQEGVPPQVLRVVKQ